MKPIFQISLLLILVFSKFSFAEEWQSITENKYKSNYPLLFEKFEQARLLIDNHSVGKKDNLITAEKLLSEILSEYVDFAPAYFDVVRMMIRMGYMSSVEGFGIMRQYLEKALIIEPDYAEIYVLYATIYYQLNEWELTREAIQQAKQHGTISPWYDMVIGKLLIHDDKAHEALAVYQNTFARKDISNRVKASAAIAIKRHYLGKKDYSSASKYLKEIIKLQPDDAYNWGNYASILLYKLGEVDEAIIHLEKAVSLAQYKMVKDALTIAYYSKWAELQDIDPELAKEFYDKAYKLNSDIQYIFNETAKSGYPVLKNTLNALAEKHGITGVMHVQPLGYQG